MDAEQSELPEILLENTQPVWLRLFAMGGAVFAVVWAMCEFTTKPDSSAGNLLLFIFGGGALVAIALFTSDLRWIIRSNEIQIDKSWIYDRQEVEFVRCGEISSVRIDRVEDDNVYFLIRLCCPSGNDIKSPPIVDAQRARELQAEIARRLNAPLEQRQLS